MWKDELSSSKSRLERRVTKLNTGLRPVAVTNYELGIVRHSFAVRFRFAIRERPKPIPETQDRRRMRTRLRPAWDIMMLTLLLGVTAGAFTGVVLGYKRLTA